MLRYIKHHLATEDNVEYFGIFSLVLFVLFFLVVVFRIWKMKNETIDELSQIPLGNDDVHIQNEL